MNLIYVLIFDILLFQVVLTGFSLFYTYKSKTFKKIYLLQLIPFIGVYFIFKNCLI